MSEPTLEQRAIIENASGCRIRVVSAVPGSGKTWTVGRAIKHVLGEDPQVHPGMAVLSFTNVAKDEIDKVLGGRTPSKLFVGTLDAFLYRFVVRPFLPSYFPECEGTWRLMPQRVGTNLHSADFEYRIVRKKKHFATVNLFDCTLLKAGVVALHPKSRQPVELTTTEQDAIIDRKFGIWNKHGLLSHGDAAYLAAEILEDEDCGQHVRDILVERFPFLVVDELQDTGESHGRCLRALLVDERFTAILVGDPDQSIYEFSGATPSSFNDFEALPGATQLPLSESRRCPRTVCRVASRLSCTEQTVKPRDDAPDGEVLCVVYDGEADVDAMIRALPRDARVVVRTNATRKMLLGRAGPSRISLGSRHLNILHRATLRILEGSTREAIAIASQAVTDACFGLKTAMDNDALRKHGVTRHRLRGEALRLLLDCIPEPDETHLEWGGRAHSSLLAAAARVSGSVPKGIRKPTSKTNGAWAPISDQHSPTAVITTVHGAKGETHATTVVFIPKSGPTKCPSAQWWDGGEEQRIAFVACSRASSKLVLCVPEKTHRRLKKFRSEFLKLFTTKTAKEWTDELRAT